MHWRIPTTCFDYYSLYLQDWCVENPTALHDMGPGTATAMVKIAEGVMDRLASKIRFMLGDTDFPPGPTQGGSTTTSTLGNGESLVCDALKKNLKELAIANVASFKTLSADDIEIKDELDQRLDSMGFSNVSTKHIKEIKAPMPGLVIDVTVKEGQEVKEGDRLLILEAMKMENSIMIHANATIKRVAVTPGQGFDKGQVLVELA